MLCSGYIFYLGKYWGGCRQIAATTNEFSDVGELIDEFCKSWTWP